MFTSTPSRSTRSTRTTRTARALVVSLGLATASAAALVATPASQAAGTRADVIVTIEAKGTDLSGSVKSKRRICKADRKVLLIRQKGVKGGKNDKVIASDTTSLRNGVWVWDTGNTGIEGRFYAKVKKNQHCRPDVSRTVRARR